MFRHCTLAHTATATVGVMFFGAVYLLLSFFIVTPILISIPAWRVAEQAVYPLNLFSVYLLSLPLSCGLLGILSIFLLLRIVRRTPCTTTARPSS